MSSIYIIGEIGINHNGDINLAKKLIDMAKECGCDAVKFQKREVDKVIPKEMWHTKKETPYGIVDYIDYKRGIELSREDYINLKDYCDKKEIDFLASAWDLDSLKFIESLNPRYHKLASPMLRDETFVEELAKYKRETIISTGMSTLNEIDEITKIFNDNKCPYILLHCVSVYPCPDNLLNLNSINTLKDRYKCRVGYSGHSSGIQDAIIACTIGATVIEKHITLDRSMFGSDQSSSIEKNGLSRMIRDIRLLNIIYGDGNKDILSVDEMKVRKKLYGR